MIDRITKQDFLSLAQKQNDPCVTIYLTTEKTGREFKPARRLKSAVKTAQQKLAGHWMSDADARNFLQPIIELSDDDDFWQHVDQGLGLFLNSDRLQRWRVAQPLDEQVFVSRQFFIKPILSVAGQDESFYVLSISQNKVELWEASESKISQVNVPDIPRSLEDLINVTSADRGSQVHTGSRELGGKKAGVYHGQGGKPDSSKQDLRDYFRQINLAVAKYLANHQEPVILLSVAEHAPIYREINSYPHLLDEIVSGSPDNLSSAEILEKTWPVMESRARESREIAIESYRKMANTTRTLSETSDILAAAHQGRIDKLFVDGSASIPGEYNESDLTIDYDVSTTDCDLDLIEDAIAQTLVHRGEVYAVDQKELPDPQAMVATLRF